MQLLKVTPGLVLKGIHKMPGDKSISHRLVILSAINNNIIQVDNFLFALDCLTTVHAMQALGVTIHTNSSELEIQGAGLYGLKSPKQILDMGNSGTSMRLLTGLLAAQAFDSELTGDDSLLNRPMARVVEPLRLMGAKITMSAANTAPLKIYGNQQLQAIEYTLPVASAQVKSAVLLAGLYTQENVIVHEPVPTRDHTERMLAEFKLNRARDNNKIVTYIVPGDLSAAAFFIVAATINSDSIIILQNIGVNPQRTGIITILKMMGADIEIMNERVAHNEPVADLQIRAAKLTGITIPTELVVATIDEFPILFIAAACAEGITTLQNAAELRVKESDRIHVMAVGLQKLGIKVQELPAGITIEGGQLQGGVIDSRGDHRVAMAFAIAGTVAKNAVIIENCHNVATSFPDFVQRAHQLGIQIEYHRT